MNLPELDISSRILSQYKDSSNLIELINILMAPLDQSMEVLGELVYRLDVDKMSGVQLDGIGDIVGIKRPRLGDEVYINETVDPDPFMPDKAYRSLLKAKIYANRSKGTIDDLLDYSYALTGEYPEIIEDFQNVCLDVSFSQSYSEQLLKIYVTYFPKAAGVCLNQITEGGDFGFAGTDENSGYSSMTQEVGKGYVRIVNP